MTLDMLFFRGLFEERGLSFFNDQEEKYHILKKESVNSKRKIWVLSRLEFESCFSFSKHNDEHHAAQKISLDMLSFWFNVCL